MAGEVAATVESSISALNSLPYCVHAIALRQVVFQMSEATIRQMQARIADLEARMNHMESIESCSSLNLENFEKSLNAAVSRLNDQLISKFDSKLCPQDSALERRLNRLEESALFVSDKARIIQELKSEIGPMLSEVRAALFEDIKRYGNKEVLPLEPKQSSRPIADSPPKKQSETKRTLPNEKADWLKELGL